MRVGICSGYFSPLGFHHLEYLNAAEEGCDYLVVIVNNDQQQKNKSGYIFQQQNDRKTVIGSLRNVDSVLLSIDIDESVAQTLKFLSDSYKTHTKLFFNSGDRNEASWNPKEVEVCEANCIEMVYLKLPKINSSSSILDNYYKWRKSHECVTISEEAIRKYRESYRLDKLEKLEYNG